MNFPIDSLVSANHALRFPLAFATSSLMTLPMAAWSVEEKIELAPVIVTATRTPQPAAKVLADVTVITSSQLEAKHGSTLAEVLQQTAGLQLSQNGGTLSTTSLFLRGADSRHTAVLIDGVRVDTQTLSGGAWWEAIPLDLIDRIEVLRGPASAVYGSDAMSGVVQILTRQGRPGPARWVVNAAVGSYGSRSLQAQVSGATDTWNYALTGNTKRSDGFNATRQDNGYVPDVANPDRDGYSQQGMTAKVGLKLTPDHRLEMNLMSTRMTVDYDGGAASTNASNYRINTWQGRWSSQWSPTWSSSVSLSQGQAHLEEKNTEYPYLTDTVSDTFTWINEWRSGHHQLQLNAEQRRDHLNNPDLSGYSTPIDTSRVQQSAAMSYQWHSPQGWTLQAQARHDRNDDFGHQTTGSAGIAVPIGSTAWKAVFNLSTGFRAPTLYQQYSEYGNKDLRPESSRNVELGLQYQKDDLKLRASLYRNRIHQLIDWVSGSTVCQNAYGCYENIDGNVRLQGLSLDAQQHWAGIDWSGRAEWLTARQLETDLFLARRAARTATFNMDKSWGAWKAGSSLQLASSRFDDAPNLHRLGGYGLLGVQLQRQLSSDWTLQFQGTNVLNKDYQLVRGYRTAPAAFMINLRWEPKR